MPQLGADWTAILSKLDFALQPIVNIHTGYCFGYEALLRRHQDVGFATPQQFFDACYTSDILTEMELLLQDKVLQKFVRLPHHDRVKLFLNLDNRSLGRLSGSHLRGLLDHYGVRDSSITFEISERHPLGEANEAARLLRRLREENLRLAIDDFGAGFSGLQMLYLAEPDLIKIDRFFISSIPTDSKKKLFVSKIVDIAHLLGAFVVAEGVETEQEYFVCKDIGCDLVQGYLVQRPTLDLAEAALCYEHIGNLALRDRRSHPSDERIVGEQVEAVEPIHIDADMDGVFDRFRANKAATFFPVVDSNHEPIGIIRERDLKEYAYSPFGKDLISNRALGKKIGHFLSTCPVAHINATAEEILQIFSTSGSSVPDAVIMVRDMRYIGLLSTQSLLRVINEKNLQAARDQNPLTKLPGNNLIHEYVSHALRDGEPSYTFVYFDFDHFKPFNDRYGFRVGDRAILLFAELLSKHLRRDDGFLGHIGGDDFFVGFRNGDLDRCLHRIRHLIEVFGEDVKSFYDEATRREGGMTAPDRDGVMRRFPLLGVSAAVLHLPGRRNCFSIEDIGAAIAELKRAAKRSPEHVASRSLSDCAMIEDKSSTEPPNCPK